MLQYQVVKKQQQQKKLFSSMSQQQIVFYSHKSPPWEQLIQQHTQTDIVIKLSYLSSIVLRVHLLFQKSHFFFL